MAMPWSQSIPQVPQGLTVVTDLALSGNHSLRHRGTAQVQATRGRPSSAQEPLTELWLPAAGFGQVWGQVFLSHLGTGPACRVGSVAVRIGRRTSEYHGRTQSTLPRPPRAGLQINTSFQQPGILGKDEGLISLRTG